MNTHTLVTHRDIQDWVSALHGQPAIRRVPDGSGEIRARLALSFAGRPTPTSTPTQDDGMMPCSWTAWLAELDRQQLALKVTDRKRPAFEFIARKDLN